MRAPTISRIFKDEKNYGFLLNRENFDQFFGSYCFTNKDIFFKDLIFGKIFYQTKENRKLVNLNVHLLQFIRTIINVKTS